VIDLAVESVVGLIRLNFEDAQVRCANLRLKQNGDSGCRTRLGAHVDAAKPRNVRIAGEMSDKINHYCSYPCKQPEKQDCAKQSFA
jgi:hypothetical protein